MEAEEKSVVKRRSCSICFVFDQHSWLYFHRQSISTIFKHLNLQYSHFMSSLSLDHCVRWMFFEQAVELSCVCFLEISRHMHADRSCLYHRVHVTTSMRSELSRNRLLDL